MKTFVEQFNVELAPTKYETVTDYDTFQNKELLDELRNKIIQNLIDNHQMANPRDMKKIIASEIDEAIEGYELSSIEISHIYNLIDNEVNGFGPITELLEDPNITEIMVNGKNEIYIEIDGRVWKDDSISFINDEHIVRTIQRMIQPLGRTIDASSPMVDARLGDGSRLNAVISPLSLNGPVLTIRKFKNDLATIDDFIRGGTLTGEMARFLEACIQSKLNLIISGGTGSGKTTMLNVLSAFVPDNERIITIEDAAELRLHQPHVISLETRLTNYEGQGEISIRDLVINSLRMRPDRIIVGECRGKEAFDMLQAMNTGHAGSMTTMHANSPSDALNRLETLILMAGMEIPIMAIRGYIEKAIDIVIHTERLNDGRRRIVSIEEVIKMQDGMIQLHPIFAFKENSILDNGEIVGEFICIKDKPEVLRRMTPAQVQALSDIFKKTRAVKKSDK